VPRIGGIEVTMTDGIKRSDLKYPNSQGDGPRRSEMAPHDGGPGQTRARRPPASASGELDRLYRSLSEVTPQNHPRTARLLASGTRKTAQKVIEEAGEVAIEAVKHHARGIVRESADLLYRLVARGIAPALIRRMCGSRCAPALTHSASRKSCPKPAPATVAKRPPERNRP
jgi:phosphoribosyl-ATP pyrophosphohydrolase